MVAKPKEINRMAFLPAHYVAQPQALTLRIQANKT
jgi:hypothetical protein